MISLADLKRKYVKFYSEVKNYIWPFSTVEDLANLEIAIFSRFPDMHEVRNLFNKFRSDIYREIHEYDELKDAVDKFQKYLESDEEIYSQLTSVTEEYRDESIKDKNTSKKDSESRRGNRSRISISHTA